MTLRTQQSVRCHCRIQPVAGQVELTALAQVIAAKQNPAILGGNASVKALSIFTAEPVEVFQFRLDDHTPFETLKSVLSKYTSASSDVPSGLFCGGWIGYFAYDLAHFIEALPRQTKNDIGLPVIRLAFYDKAVLFDHTRNRFSFLALEMDGTEPVASKFTVLADWFRQAAQQHPQPPDTSAIEQLDPADLQANMTRADYFDALRQIHRHIYDGDVYQINFSQRFSTPCAAPPIDVFNWQNRRNPSPYAAYLAWDDIAVVSASPELFLDVRADRIRTCPIKGTRPRDAALPDDAPFNRAQSAALHNSPKDRAELAMIVDLERNDLARICVPGSRYVSCARRIEAFPTVYHAVATVEGTLAAPPGPDRIETLLRATFPGGSITGAPKIRAMQIIEALEPTTRGVYTGAIGWIGLNFDLCLNIAIRTVIIQNKTAHVQTGGGIVADSDPRAEWDETLIKANALLAALRHMNK